MYMIKIIKFINWELLYLMNLPITYYWFDWLERTVTHLENIGWTELAVFREKY